MEKIYSKVEPGTLLHIIHTSEDFPHGKGRVDICQDNEFLQCAALALEEGQTFKPHKHIYCEKKTTIAQESWVVIKGMVLAKLYDLDDSLIAEKMLMEGDCSITFRGGHNYQCMTDNTKVLEYKTGPYLGQENDKEFIEEKQ